MVLVNDLLVPTFFDRVYRARGRAHVAFRMNPCAKTLADLTHAKQVYQKRYGCHERAVRLMTRTERTQLYKAP